MDLKCSKPEVVQSGNHFIISGSKSESNRLLILKALYADLTIKNLSESDDTEHLASVLASEELLLDIGHAGTAMRFGTAYFAAQDGKHITLTGSDRMKQRPIGILVDALNNLGASVTYVDQVGYPPLAIAGKKLKGGKLAIDATVSSQYLTALLLIAPSFENGLELELIGKLTSRPYLEMTISLLQQLGVNVKWIVANGSETIKVNTCKAPVKTTITVESDWSSAGYWYSWVALQEPDYELTLAYFKQDSLQGDHKLITIYAPLGVSTHFMDGKMVLRKTVIDLPPKLTLDLTAVPDQAQTIFATCLGLGIDAYFTGLHTLKIKETDRIEAMKVVGLRFRESIITTTDSTLELKVVGHKPFEKTVIVDTYNDHRMAMAFAPLALRTEVIIKDAGVVSKSYGAFWQDLKKLNLKITEI